MGRLNLTKIAATMYPLCHAKNELCARIESPVSSWPGIAGFGFDLSLDTHVQLAMQWFSIERR